MFDKAVRAQSGGLVSGDHAVQEMVYDRAGATMVGEHAKTCVNSNHAKKVTEDDHAKNCVDSNHAEIVVNDDHAKTGANGDRTRTVVVGDHDKTWVNSNHAKSGKNGGRAGTQFTGNTQTVQGTREAAGANGVRRPESSAKQLRDFEFRPIPYSITSMGEAAAVANDVRHARTGISNMHERQPYYSNVVTQNSKSSFPRACSGIQNASMNAQVVSDMQNEVYKRKMNSGATSEAFMAQTRENEWQLKEKQLQTQIVRLLVSVKGGTINC
jgi:hypothetical protein